MKKSLVTIFTILLTISLWGQANFKTEEYVFSLKKNVGLINKKTAYSDIIKMFGKQNIKNDKVYIGEGESTPATIVFPKDNFKKIYIVWKNIKSKNEVREIRVEGEKSIWKLENGITLGTTLKELEKMNGKSFVLLGFGWDYEGAVTSWDNGQLSSISETVALRLNGGNKISESELSQVSGDSEFSSSNPVIQKMNPGVQSILLFEKE